MISGYRKQFYKIFFKKACRDIPKIFAVILLVAIISAGIIMGIVSVCGENVTKLSVAYVFEAEDSLFKVGLKYMARSANCDFIQYEEDEALEALDKKEVAAVLIIYNNEEEQTPDNPFPITSIRFIYNDNGDFVASAFGNIVNAGLRDFMVLNSTSDAVRRTYTDYSRSEINQLEDDLLDYLWHRNRYYDKVTYYDAGDIPVKYYYIGNAVVLISLLSSSVILGFSKNEDKKFTTFAKRVGITDADIFLAKYLPVILFFLLLNTVISIAYQLYALGGTDVMVLASSIISTLLILFPVILIHELISDKMVSTLCSVFYSIVAMFLSGNIIPLTFLPQKMERISNFIITKYPSRLLGQIFYGKTNTETVKVSLIILAVIIAVTVSTSLIRGKNND